MLINIRQKHLVLVLLPFLWAKFFLLIIVCFQKVGSQQYPVGSDCGKMGS